MPLIRLRELLNEHFMAFPNVAIIGGLVRDFARKGRTGFRSDIDLVIDAPADNVRDLAANLRASPNRFGGFSFCHPQWKVDFWALETTWASTNGHVKVRNFEDLTRCTFFDFDAALYDLKTRTILCEAGYLEKLRSRQLDINLAATPSLRGNLLRSVRRLLLWNVAAGPKLENFIVRNLNPENFNAIRITEQAVYPNPILPRFQSEFELMPYLFDISERSQLDISFATQLTLPGIMVD